VSRRICRRPTQISPSLMATTTGYRRNVILNRSLFRDALGAARGGLCEISEISPWLPESSSADPGYTWILFINLHKIRGFSVTHQPRKKGCAGRGEIPDISARGGRDTVESAPPGACFPLPDSGSQSRVRVPHRCPPQGCRREWEEMRPKARFREGPADSRLNLEQETAGTTTPCAAPLCRSG